jgi:transposase
MCTRRWFPSRLPRAIAAARPDKSGFFENRPEVLAKLATRLNKLGHRLSFCYEAGPCGYGLHRLLTGCGHGCVVVAPSLIPIKAGDRVKTDRRDALMLAKLHRAGELTAIWIPDAAHQAMRDLVRARRQRAGFRFGRTMFRDCSASSF